MTQPSERTRVALVPAQEMHRAVKPFNYNPSSWRQRIPIAVLALVAAGISFYMSLFQWGFIDSVWDPVFGDQSNKVLKSDVAHDMFMLIGIHDAALGVLAYLGDAILGLAGSERRWQYRPWMVILFGIDVVPLGIISAVLVGMQAFVVGYWCFPCIVTAIISLILVWWAWDEIWISIVYLRRVYKAGGATHLWWAVWGIRKPLLDQVANEMLA
jgi:uncharacterized membrane protein